MRVLVIGCGSIGSRRARLLAEMGHTLFCDDIQPARAGQVAAMCASITARPAMSATMVDEAAYSAADAAFICTPPDTHVPLAMQCLEAGVPVFVEKPLSVSMDGVAELVEAARGTPSMGACNMRWACGLAGPRESRWRSARFVTSKPLSDWRPGAAQAYRHTGIVLEMAWHDIDLAYLVGGPFQQVQTMGNADAVTVMLEHRSGIMSVVYAAWGEDAETMRYMSVAGDGEPIRIEPDTSDAMYRREMQHFLECVEAGRPTCNPLDSAAHVLEWALRAQGTNMEGAA